MAKSVFRETRSIQAPEYQIVACVHSLEKKLQGAVEHSTAWSRFDLESKSWVTFSFVTALWSRSQVSHPQINLRILCNSPFASQRPHLTYPPMLLPSPSLRIISSSFSPSGPNFREKATGHSLGFWLFGHGETQVSCIPRRPDALRICCALFHQEIAIPCA